MTISWGAPCLAPAKINEFLHITGRLNNGYHQLQTVFRLINFSDVLYFYPRKDNLVRLISEHNGVDAQNDLATKAAKLLQQYTNTDQGVDIRIEKNIPLGSGLGGGSSNAATTLIALNALWKTGLNSQTLQTLGLQIGTDVPFFIFGHDAFAEGIGNEFTELDLPKKTYLLLLPPISVTTSAIFKALDCRDFAEPIKPEDYYSGFGCNMLTATTVKQFAVIQTYIDWLSQFTNAAMSGSGAVVFGRFADEKEANHIFNQRPRAFKGIITTSLSLHPLYKLREA